MQVVMFMYLLQSVMHCSPAPAPGLVTFLIIVNCLVTGHGAALVLLKLSTECLALALQCRRYSEQTEPAESVFSLNAAVNVLSSDTDVTFCPCWHFQQFLLVGIFQLANLINFLARLITGGWRVSLQMPVCVRLVWRSDQF